MNSISRLRELLIDALPKHLSYEVDKDSLFRLSLGGHIFIVYIKNMTPAYFKSSPNIIRVQLPNSIKFKNIANERHPFVVLGYDQAYDSFSSWDPTTIKTRLNKKTNVSLYSRTEFIMKAQEVKLSHDFLSTGEKVSSFQRKYAPFFFKSIEKSFTISPPKKKNIHIQSSKNEILTVITDPNIIRKIKPLLESDKILEAVELSSKLHGNAFKHMSFSDWFEAIKKLHANINI